MGGIKNYSAIPAMWVDALYLKEPNSLAAHSYHFLKGIVISQLVFPSLALIDFTIYSARAIKEWVWAVISLDVDEEVKHLRQAKRLQEFAFKHFLGLLFFPGGLICPDLITHHFLPDHSTENMIKPCGGLYSAPGKEIEVESLKDVLELVQKAKREGRQVTISGARMSQGKQILPTDKTSISINMLKMNKVVINTEKQTAIVEGGATWSDVQKKGDQEGLALKVMQASNIFSLGGSIGANIHGWDHHSGTLAETIRKLWIVNGDGHLEVLGPEDELFGLVIGGYGQFGVVVQAEIDLTQNEQLIETGESVLPADYVKYFENHVLTNLQTRMHLYRLSIDPNKLLEEGIAVNYNCVGNLKGRVSPELADEPERGSLFDRMTFHLARRFAIIRSLYWWCEKRRIQSNREKLTRNQIMRAPIRAAMHQSLSQSEWLQEYFVPGKDLAPFLRKLTTILKKNHVPLLNATVRYVKQDRLSEMGYAKKGDRYAVVLFFTQHLADEKIQKTKKWVQEVIDEVIKCSGSYYLPYHPFATEKQFKEAYPNAAYVESKKLEYDVEGRFKSQFSKKYFKQSYLLTQEEKNVC